MQASVNALQFELGCLSKTYFDSEALFIAELAGKVVGFAHLGPAANRDLTDSAVEVATIAALCVSPLEEEAGIAAALLAEVESAATRKGANRCVFRSLLPDVAFYLGLGPAGSLIGATSHEHRMHSWLTSNDYQASEETILWTLDLASFRPPVDRQQMQIRRTAHVNRDVDEPFLPWWQACLLGHTEPTSLQLIHRTEKRVMHEVLCWTVASELKTDPSTNLWLWPPKLDSVDDTDSLLFLLGESMREFSDERVDYAIVASASHQTHLNDLYRRLGFSAEQSGAIYEKQLSR